MSSNVIRSGTLHFTLDDTFGEGFTDLVRQMAWYECKRDKAIIMLLGSMGGMTLEQAESILDGKMKLITASDNIHCQLEKDDWKPPTDEIEKMKKNIEELLKLLNIIPSKKPLGGTWFDNLLDSEQKNILQTEGRSIQDLMKYNIWESNSKANDIKRVLESVMKDNSERWSEKLGRVREIKEERFEDKEETKRRIVLVSPKKAETIEEHISEEILRTPVFRIPDILEEAKGKTDFFLTTTHDWEIKDKIPLSRGVGLSFSCKSSPDEVYETAPRDKKSLREVVLKITSWIGTSIGAVHWYARLEVPSLDVICTKGKRKGERLGISCGGSPKEAAHLTVDITRIMEKDLYEYDHNAGKPVVRVKKGEHFYGFDSKAEAIQKGKEEFNRLFGEWWILKIEE